MATSVTRCSRNQSDNRNSSAVVVPQRSLCFSLLFIYRFHGPARPFFRTGIAFNRVFDVSGATACARGPFGEQFYCIDGSPAAELRHRGTPGFVAGGGVGRKLGK